MLRRNQAEFEAAVNQWLSTTTETCPNLKGNIPAVLNTILSIIKMQQVPKEIRNTDQVDDLIKFFETYSRSWRYLEQTGIPYLRVVNNFNLNYDYLSQYGTKLFDYYSDLALMGLMTIDYCNKLIVKQEKADAFDDYLKVYAVLAEVGSCIGKAREYAEKRDKEREEHSRYVNRLQYYMKQQESNLSYILGQLAIQRGVCEYAAYLFQRARSAEMDLLKEEKDETIKEFYRYHSRHVDAMTSFAWGCTWLEASMMEIEAIKTSLPSKPLWDRIRAKLSSPRPLSLELVEKRLNEEIARIEQACKELTISLDRKVPPGLSKPDMQQFGDAVKLPELNTHPPPLD